jgi:hypothetical protein
MKSFMHLGLLAIFLLTSCKKEDNVVLPSVEMVSITEVTANTVKITSKVTDDGGGIVSGAGVCWGLSLNPDLSAQVYNAGAGKGTFISVLTNLTNNTTYHVRAFATNEKGTVYSTDRTFTTTR